MKFSQRKRLNKIGLTNNAIYIMQAQQTPFGALWSHPYHIYVFIYIRDGNVANVANEH